MLIYVYNICICICIHIYIYIFTGVCEMNTPSDKNTGWKVSFDNIESGAGLQFLPQGCMAKVRVNGKYGLLTPV